MAYVPFSMDKDTLALGAGANGILKEAQRESRTMEGSPIKKKMKEIYDTGNNQTNQVGSITHNWYQQRPYAFKFTNKNDQVDIFYLPISPYNINITTHFATNVISTMYGTVEEHSEQRYYDIVISGTTGMSPKYYDVKQDMPDVDSQSKTRGRASYPVKAGYLDNVGLLKRQAALINNTLNKVTDLIGKENGSTGVDLRKTGYTAFHNFYKFLLVYKKDVSGQYGLSGPRRTHPLTFINYKDNNQYDVAVQGFQLIRSANEPMIYNYNITLRAYNLREADSSDEKFDVQDRKKDLGLDGLGSSFFSDFAQKIGGAKQAIGSAAGAVGL